MRIQQGIEIINRETVKGKREYCRVDQKWYLKTGYVVLEKLWVGTDVGYFITATASPLEAEPLLRKITGYEGLFKWKYNTWEGMFTLSQLIVIKRKENKE